jgi:hypothetical protein
MALCLLSFCTLDGDSSVSGVTGLVIILVHAQTGFAFFLCFFLFRLRGFLRRLPFVVPALVFFRITRLSPALAPPFWADQIYRNTMLPSMTFCFAVFGLLLPALSFVVLTPSLVPRVIAPAVAFTVLAFVRLQPDARLNFRALIPTAIPLFVASAFAALVAFRDRWESADVRGLVNCGMVFATCFMCLSSLAGLWARGAQKVTAWDADAVDLGKWVQQHTPKAAVFTNPVPRRWNPAVVIAGRSAYYPYAPTVECDVHARAVEFSAFIYQNATLTDVEYYVVEKKTKLAGKMAEKVGVFVDLVYQNAKLELYRARL